MFTLYTLAVSLLGSCTPADTLEVSRMPENFAAATPARVWHTLEAEEADKLPCPTPAALASLLLSEGKAYVCRLYNVTGEALEAARAINRRQAKKDRAAHVKLAKSSAEQETFQIWEGERLREDRSAECREAADREAGEALEAITRGEG
jgi:hypothetical protein